MNRTIRSPSRSRRFTIVTTLLALVASGAALAADPHGFGDARDGRRVERPGSGPGHDFVDRGVTLVDRMMRTLGVDTFTRLLGRSANSCLVCPTAPPEQVERPVPPARPNLHRPRNQGPRDSTHNWLFPR